MTSQEQGFHDFAASAATLNGDEKSEAQTFRFHLLEAYGHDANMLPAGASFEPRNRSWDEPRTTRKQRLAKASAAPNNLHSVGERPQPE